MLSRAPLIFFDINHRGNVPYELWGSLHIARDVLRHYLNNTYTSRMCPNEFTANKKSFYIRYDIGIVIL